MTGLTICAAAPAPGSSLWVQWTLSKRCQPSIVSFAGEISFANADFIGTTLRSVLAANPHRLIFDLTGVRFADASGWRALRGVRQQAARRSLRLDVVCSGPVPPRAAGPAAGLYGTLAEALDAQEPARRAEALDAQEPARRAEAEGAVLV